MKQEVRRGRKFIEYHDPETQDANTFTQVIGAHDVSYQETVGGSWLPVNESWETDGQDGFSFRAHRMNHKVRFDSIGAWRWYPRRNVETEYIVINRPRCWLTATKRWGNLLVNGISREGRDITLTSVRKVTRVIHSRWNGIKTDWILLDSTAPAKFRQQIDLVGLTELDGWLYGADGEKVALLTPTTATDANGAELPCSGSYVDGYLQFEADVTGAVYPVTIDPDFAGGTADGFVYGNDATFATARSTAGGFKITDSNHTVGIYWSGAVYQPGRMFLKFDTSSIGGSSTVTQVNLKVQLYAAYLETSNDWDCQIVKQDWSAYDPITADNMEAIYDACLAGTADDNILFATDAGLARRSWITSGNLSTAWIAKDGSTYYSLRSSNDYDNIEPNPPANESVRIFSSEEATYGKPTLVITYTGASGALLRVNMNAQMQNLSGGIHG